MPRACDSLAVTGRALLGLVSVRQDPKTSQKSSSEE